MSIADLAFGRAVVWRGLPARIIDIQWRGPRTRVHIRIAGRRPHWTWPAELEAL